MPKVEIEMSEETLASIRGAMGDYRIVVLPGRWNLAGYYNLSDDGKTVTMRDAVVIRYWGTTRGLGEIAENGPTSKTKLDKLGTVEFELSQQIMSIASRVLK